MPSMQWRKADGSFGLYEGPLFELGAGIPRPMGDHGLRRALFDLAFGYVSGFPVRDILAFSIRSLFPHRVLPGETSKETREQQRTRILTDHPEIDPFQYDSLVALGYEPESLDGFYRVPAIDQPVQWMSPTSALVAEAIPLTSEPGERRSAINYRSLRDRIHWVHRTGVRPIEAAGTPDGTA